MMRILAALIVGLALSNAPAAAQSSDEPRTETVVR
jgi:hypothetical protein